MACWDIVGKALEKPVYELIGGLVNERVRSYTYLYPDESQDPAHFYNDPDLSAERAAVYVDQGFTAVKFDPAGPYTASTTRTMPSDESIMDTVGRVLPENPRGSGQSGRIMLFGTHGQFTSVRRHPHGAPAGRRMNRLWFEEPVPAGNAGGDGKGRCPERHPDCHRGAPDHEV